MPLLGFSNGGNKNKKRRKEEKNKKRKIPKIVAYGAFDETVCTAPLGPKKWKTNHSTKINLIGCDTIVNSPSSFSFLTMSHLIVGKF